MFAFVAGELISRKGYSGIYDYSTGQTYHFKTRLTEYEVDVVELETKSQLAGGAFGKHFSLNHYAEGANVEINLAGKGFDGEHSKGPHFKGSVKDNLVTFLEGDSQYVFGLL